MKHRLKTAAKQLPLILFVLVLLFSGFTAYHYAYHITDSDAASELVLGKLLADQNKIVTSDWLYSSEIRFFGTNLVYMPLFKIFSDWQIVRFVSILVFLAILAGSYYYLSRRMKLSRNAYFLSASLLLLPVSVVYGRLTLFHNYYTPYAVYGFLIAGLYLSFLEHRGQKRLWQALRLAAMLTLSLMSCLNGFRQLPAAILPLFIAALMTAVREYRDAPDILADIPRRNWTPVLWAGTVLAAGMAGLAVHNFVLPRFFQFQLMNSSVLAIPTVEKLRNILVGYVSLFGFQEGRTLFSAAGIQALCSVFAAAVLLAVSLQDLVPKQRPASFPGAFMGTLYPVAMLLMTLTFLLSIGKQNYPQYYLPSFYWVFPYLGLHLDRIPVSAKRITTKQALIMLACLCLLLSGVLNNRYYLNPAGKQVTYDVRIKIDEWNRREGAIGFIEKNGLEIGYAEFWDASVVAEATGGRVTMIPLSFDTTHLVLAYHDVLSDLRAREEAFVEDKSVFMLLPVADGGAFCQTGLAQHGMLAYEDEDYQIYTFDSSTVVWEHLNQ